MLFSLAVTSVAGYIVFTNLQRHATVEVPLKKIDNSLPPMKAVPIATPTPAAAASEPDASTGENSEKTDTSDNTPGETRKILFSYRSSVAKRVYIVGDFNKWFRQPLTKKGKTWSVSLDLKPGNYEYKYVVDNKRIRDPNNKTATVSGNSLIVVKPAS